MSNKMIPANPGRVQPPQVRQRFIDAPTQEQMEQAKNDPMGKLRFSRVMAVGRNPKQATGTCRQRQGLRAIALIVQIIQALPPLKILNCKILHGRLHRYFNSAIINMVAIVVEKFAYGLSYEIGSEFRSLSERFTEITSGGDAAEIAHFDLYVQTFCNHIFNWVVPYYKVKLTYKQVLDAHPKMWILNQRKQSLHPRQHATGSNRAGLPLWSTKHVHQLIQDETLQHSDRNMCKGHNLELTLLMHRLFDIQPYVLPASNGRLYVADDEDVEDMFATAFNTKFRSESDAP